MQALRSVAALSGLKLQCARKIKRLAWRGDRYSAKGRNISAMDNHAPTLK
jgi:hypothetical protein